MGRYSAYSFLVLGVPLLFGTGCIVTEYILSVLRPDLYDSGVITPQSLDDIGPNHLIVCVLVPFAVGLYNVAVLLGLKGRYAIGADGLHPRYYPWRYVRLKLRRYCFVPVAVTTSIVLLYFTSITGVDRLNLPHRAVGYVAFIASIRPLNMGLGEWPIIAFKVLLESMRRGGQGWFGGRH